MPRFILKRYFFQKLIHLEHSNCSCRHTTRASWPFTSRPCSPWPSWPRLCLLSACTVRFSHNTLFWTPPLHQLHCQLQSSFAFIIPGTCTAFFPCFLLPQTLIKSWSFSVTLQIFSDPSLISVPLWSALTKTRIYSYLSKFTFMLLLWCSHFCDPDDKLITLEKYTQNKQFFPFDLSCIRIVFFKVLKIHYKQQGPTVYSTENCIQYPMTIHNGKDYVKRVYINVSLYRSD